MPIAVDIDVMLARRKMPVGELADRIGITPANLAVLKNGRAEAVRFTTLAALCCAGRLTTLRVDDRPRGGRRAQPRHRRLSAYRGEPHRRRPPAHRLPSPGLAQS